MEINTVLRFNIGNASRKQNHQFIFNFRSVLQMVFVLFQMYFVFLNQKVKTILFQRVSTEYFSVQMNIYKNRFLSRLGLMHMIATNLCVWLKVLVLETQHGLHFDMHHHQLDEVIRSKLVRFPIKNISLLNKIFLTATWLTVGI